MNNVVVIYKSKYGTTKQYAELIAQALEAPIFEASKVKPSRLLSYDVVVYGGCLYAGRIGGIELVAKNPCKLLVVFTVGIANPDITDYSVILKKNFAPDLLSTTKVFHLRGGINYKKLGIIHKGMMVMLKKTMANKAETELSSDDKAILETSGGKADFTDKNTIEPIVEFVKGNVEWEKSCGQSYKE